MNLTLSHCGNPMTNFDFLLSYLDFAPFGEAAANKIMTSMQEQKQIIDGGNYELIPE